MGEIKEKYDTNLFWVNIQQLPKDKWNELTNKKIYQRPNTVYEIDNSTYIPKIENIISHYSYKTHNINDMYLEKKILFDKTTIMINKMIKCVE